MAIESPQSPKEMEFTSRPSQSPFYRWTSVQAELLWIYDDPVAPASRNIFGDHRYGYWVWLLRKGRVRVQRGGRTWNVRVGQWIVLPQDLITHEFSDDAHILSVHFRCQWPTGENLFLGQDAIIWNAASSPRLERSALALNRLVRQHFPRIRSKLTEQNLDYPEFLRIEQRFLQWLTEFYRVLAGMDRPLAQAEKCDERLLRALKCLHDHPLGEKFPLDQLQKDTGLGRTHMDRLYQHQFGVTTREYWERLRQDAATRKLQSTALSIKEIGGHLGFRHTSHFTKWFCQRLGMTPTAYREQPPSDRT